jgi:CheY-like chemotaxis protein
VTAARARVLILDQDPDLLTRHSTLLLRRGSEVVAETATTITDALQRIRKAGFDAVVCRVDNPEEVSFLIRIRNLAPRMPLVAVTSGTNPALEDLARESGANAVQVLGDGAGEPEEKTALRIRRLIQKSRAMVRRSRDLRMEGRELVAEHRWIIARNRLFSPQRLEQIQEGLRRFVRLLVEDSHDQVFLCGAPFTGRRCRSRCPSCTTARRRSATWRGPRVSGTGQVPAADSRDPGSPSPPEVGVRRHPVDPHAARAGAAAGVHADDLAGRAGPGMAMGVSDYFTKPMGFEPLVSVVRAIAMRWWFNTEAYANLSRSE